MSNQAEISPISVEVELDKPRSIRYSRLAEYRMGTLPAPFEIPDLRRPTKAFAALVAWVWASLEEKEWEEFPTPEKVAVLLTEDNTLPLLSAFTKTYNAGKIILRSPPKKGSKPKNG